MRKAIRAMAGVLAGVLLLGSMAGCGRKNITVADYPTTTVATLGDVKVTLEEANYQAKMAQYESEYYYSMFGMDIKDMWAQSMGSSTMAVYTKTNVMQTIAQTKILCKKAGELGITLTDAEKEKTAEVAKQWREGLYPEVEAVAPVSDELLNQMAEENALAVKAYAEAIKDVDTNVADEDARQRTILYYQVKENDDVDADAAKKQAEDLLAEVKAGTLPSSETADGVDNLVYNTVSFGEGDYNNKLEELALTLKTEESGSIYDEAGSWYVVYCKDDFDKEATDKKKESIIADRKTALFEEVYAEWVKAMPEFKVDENVWSVVKLEKNLYVPQAAPETEAAEEETK